MERVISFIYKGEAEIEAKDHPVFRRIANLFHLTFETDLELISTKKIDADSELPFKKKKVSSDLKIISMTA